MKREQVKLEVAIEILSNSMAIAIQNNDEEKLKEISELNEKIYLGDKSAIEESIEKYGKYVKNLLEDTHG